MSRARSPIPGRDGKIIEGPPGWRNFAACHGMPPEMFYPHRGDNDTVNAAKAVCDRCPVASYCAHYGLREHWGVWGGLSEKQRRRLRRHLAQAS